MIPKFKEIFFLLLFILVPLDRTKKTKLLLMLRARHAHKHDCASASSETLTRCFAAEPPGGGTRCRMAGQLITHEIGRPVQSDFWPAVGALDNIRTVLFRCRSRWTKHKTTREAGEAEGGGGQTGIHIRLPTKDTLVHTSGSGALMKWYAPFPDSQRP